MIKRFEGYESTKAYGDSVQLPRGAYVCKIIGTKIIDTDYGQSVKVALDIAEGEFAGFFKAKFDANTSEDKKWGCSYLLGIPKDDGTCEDGWTKRKFKTFTDALEDSNSGYHFDWDETKFNGKLIGVLFNYREYVGTDGNVYSTANAAQVATIANVREGNIKLPQDKLLPDSARPSQSLQNSAHESEDIPF